MDFEDRVVDCREANTQSKCKTGFGLKHRAPSTAAINIREQK